MLIEKNSILNAYINVYNKDYVTISNSYKIVMKNLVKIKLRITIQLYFTVRNKITDISFRSDKKAITCKRLR